MARRRCRQSGRFWDQHESDCNTSGDCYCCSGCARFCLCHPNATRRFFWGRQCLQVGSVESEWAKWFAQTVSALLRAFRLLQFHSVYLTFFRSWRFRVLSVQTSMICLLFSVIQISMICPLFSAIQFCRTIFYWWLKRL